MEEPLFPKQMVAKKDGTIIWEDKLDSLPQMIGTNAASYNLNPNKRTILMAFYGSTTNLNLPLLNGNMGVIILLYNGGTGDVNIIGNPSDGNSIIDGGMEMPSTTLTSGSPMTVFSMLVNNVPKWIAKP